jgi:hypothetical protein
MSMSVFNNNDEQMNFWAVSPPSPNYVVPSPINISPSSLQARVRSPIGIAISPRSRKLHPNARLYIPIDELTNNNIYDILIDLENESKSFIHRYIKRYFRIYEHNALEDPEDNDEESIHAFERIPEVRMLFNNFITNTIDIILRISQLPQHVTVEDKIIFFRTGIDDAIDDLEEDYYQQERVDPLILGVDIEGITHDRNMDYMYNYNRKNRLTIPYKIQNYLAQQPLRAVTPRPRPLNRKTRRAIYKREKRELDFINEQGQNSLNVYDGGALKHKHKWSLKYKRSIDCKHPKGFSQRQHCKYGRKTMRKFRSKK